MDALNALCAKVLGQPPDRVEPFTSGPSGEVRGTRRVHVGGRIVYERKE